MSFSRITAYGKIFILVVAQITFAVYNPNNPHMIENFNPANARPLGFITCVGDKSDQLLLPTTLPTHHGDPFDPTTKTMQQLCAKPQYNGGNQYEHVGGFCALSTYADDGQDLTGDVYFDLTIGARINTNLATPRMLAECAFRCYCSNVMVPSDPEPNHPVPLAPPLVAQRDHINVQPKYIAASDDMIKDRPSDRLDSTYQQDVAVPDNYNIQYPMLDEYLHHHDTAEYEEATVDSFACEVEDHWVDQNFDEDLPELPRTNTYFQQNRDRTIHSSISLDPLNKIVCEGPLPAWDLPPPYTVEDFKPPKLAGTSYRGLNSFCAVYQSGGFP